MSATLRTSDARSSPRRPAPAAADEPRTSPATAPLRLELPQRLELVHAFLSTVWCYLSAIAPAVRSELANWSAMAVEIPDGNLRRTAAEALRKRGNIEGAALFATLAPAAQRRRTVRALVAFQTAYNYLDALSEQPNGHPLANGERLHEALLVALAPGAPHPDYYAYNPDREDGGYLTAILDSCRGAIAELPSFAAAEPAARTAAERIVRFQALNLSEAQGGHGALERWASEATPAGSGLAWWETAAAAGSSLAVYALIAAAAQAQLDWRQARAIEHAYFPSIGALHSLLDSLVDRREDHEQGQRSLLDHYSSQLDATLRLAALARRARRAIEPLPSRHAHRVILTAMCSYYLSAAECDSSEARTIARALTRVLGLPLNVAIAMFAVKRLLHALARGTYS